MATFAIASGAAKTSGSPTTQSFSTSNLGGLTPALAIFHVSNATNHGGTAAAHAMRSRGWATNEATDQSMCVAHYAKDNVGTMVEGAMHSTTACILVLDDNGTAVTIDGRAVISGFSSNTVTIDWTNYPTNAVQIDVLLIAGADVQVTALDVTNLAVLNTEYTHTVGFQPKWGILGKNDNANNEAERVKRGAGWGYFTYDGATITQAADVIWGMDAALTSRAAGQLVNNRACTGGDAGALGNLAREVEVTAVGATTIGLTSRNVVMGTRDVIVLLVDHDEDPDLQIIDSPNSAASDWTISSFSGTPKALLMDLTSKPLVNTAYGTSDAGTSGSYMADDSGTEGCQSVTIEDDAATSNNHSFAHTKAYLRNDADTSTLYELGNPTFNSTGWTFTAANITTASATTHKWIALAFVSSATGATVDLTGVSATAQIGSLTATGGAAVTMTGVSSTAGVGDLSATGGASVTLDGVESVAGVGDLSAVIGMTVTLTGVEASAAVGTLSAVGGASATLTGVEAAAEIGVLSASVGTFVTLSGVEASAQVGDLSATGGAVATLSGVESAAQVGTLDAAIGVSVTLTGVEATGGVGAFSVTGGAAVTLTGVEAVGIANGLVVDAGIIVPQVHVVSDGKYLMYRISEVETDGSVTLRQRHVRPGGKDSYVATSSPYTFNPKQADYGLRPYNITVLENKTGAAAVLNFNQPEIDDVGDEHTMILIATDGNWSINSQPSGPSYYKCQTAGPTIVNSGQRGLLHIKCVDDDTDRYWWRIGFTAS